MNIIGLGGIGSKTSAVYTDPKTGKKYSLQYVSYKKKWELDIIKKSNCFIVNFLILEEL